MGRERKWNYLIKKMDESDVEYTLEKGEMAPIFNQTRPRVCYRFKFNNKLGMSVVRDKDISFFSKGFWEMLPLDEEGNLYTEQCHHGNTKAEDVVKMAQYISRLNDIEEFRWIISEWED